MHTSLLKSTISHGIFAQSHSKSKHHNKTVSCTPLISLKPSNYKALMVLNAPKITFYHDKWLDIMAINHLSHSLQAVAGIQVDNEGYDGLLEACKVVTANYNPLQQQQLCLEGLKRSIPNQLFPLLKALVPPSKFTREFLAKFTCLFFAWLVGPSEVFLSVMLKGGSDIAGYPFASKKSSGLATMSFISKQRYCCIILFYPGILKAFEIHSLNCGKLYLNEGN